MKAIVKKYSGENKIKLNLENGGKIIYIPNYVQNIDEIKSELKNDIPWEQPCYNMYGKQVPTPRYLFALGKLNEKYKITDTMKFTPLVKQLKKEIEKDYDTKLQYAQLNLYRHNKDYIGWHNDKEVLENDSVYSISLGASRRFQLRPIKYKSMDTYIKYEINLISGSLLIMNEDAVKTFYEHTIVKETKTCKKRYNITFRNK